MIWNWAVWTWTSLSSPVLPVIIMSLTCTNQRPPFSPTGESYSRGRFTANNNTRAVSFTLTSGQNGLSDGGAGSLN